MLQMAGTVASLQPGMGPRFLRAGIPGAEAAGPGQMHFAPAISSPAFVLTSLEF